MGNRIAFLTGLILLSCGEKPPGYDGFSLYLEAPEGEEYVAAIYSKGEKAGFDAVYAGENELYCPAGTFSILTYPARTVNAVINDESWDGISVELCRASDEACSLFRTARSLTSRGVAVPTGSPGSESDAVCGMPGSLFLGMARNQRASSRLSMSAESISKGFFLRISDISGIEWLSGAEAFITNMASGVRPQYGMAATSAAALYSELSLDLDTGSISGEIRHIGIGPDFAGQCNTLYLIVTDTAGKSFLYIYDISRQLPGACAQDQAEMALESGIEISKPESGGGGGGFDATLQNWGEVHVCLSIGQ